MSSGVWAFCGWHGPNPDVAGPRPPNCGGGGCDQYPDAVGPCQPVGGGDASAHFPDAAGGPGPNSDGLEFRVDGLGFRVSGL